MGHVRLHLTREATALLRERAAAHSTDLAHEATLLMEAGLRRVDLDRLEVRSLVSIERAARESEAQR